MRRPLLILSSRRLRRSFCKLTIFKWPQRKDKKLIQATEVGLQKLMIKVLATCF